MDDIEASLLHPRKQQQDLEARASAYDLCDSMMQDLNEYSKIKHMDDKASED
jgi:hypothetical protein